MTLPLNLEQNQKCRKDIFRSDISKGFLPLMRRGCIDDDIDGDDSESGDDEDDVSDLADINVEKCGKQRKNVSIFSVGKG